MPFRQLGEKYPIDDLSNLADVLEGLTEYTICVNASENPADPPLAIGYNDSGKWTPFKEDYNLEIAFQVRNHTVRLAQLESEDELNAPLDPANLPTPTFDEDCEADSTAGVFVHPELDAYTLSKGGCACSWVEFRYGKFVYPRAINGSAEVMRGDIIDLTKSLFENDVIEASHWG